LLLKRRPDAVVLRAEPADDEDARLADDLVWQVDRSTSARLEPPWLVLESQGKGRTRHMALHVWVRQIVDDILPPLHAVHALSRAEVVVRMPGVPDNPPRAGIQR